MPLAQTFYSIENRSMKKKRVPPTMPMRFRSQRLHTSGLQGKNARVTAVSRFLRFFSKKATCYHVGGRVFKIRIGRLKFQACNLTSRLCSELRAINRSIAHYIDVHLYLRIFVYVANARSHRILRVSPLKNFSHFLTRAQKMSSTFAQLKTRQLVLTLPHLMCNSGSLISRLLSTNFIASKTSKLTEFSS